MPCLLIGCRDEQEHDAEFIIQLVCPPLASLGGAVGTPQVMRSSVLVGGDPLPKAQIFLVLDEQLFLPLKKRGKQWKRATVQILNTCRLTCSSSFAILSEADNFRWVGERTISRLAT
jgi:hypothetical protein